MSRGLGVDVLAGSRVCAYDRFLSVSVIVCISSFMCLFGSGGVFVWYIFWRVILCFLPRICLCCFVAAMASSSTMSFVERFLVCSLLFVCSLCLRSCVVAWFGCARHVLQYFAYMFLVIAWGRFCLMLCCDPFYIISFVLFS